jgi:hypothetical protein
MADLKNALPDRLVFICLFPLTYLFHIAEEYWAGEGYPAYLLRTYGTELSPTRFLMLQSLGMALMVAGILIARNLRFPHLLLIILATVFLKNSLTHTIRSVLRAEYEPGLLTSLVLWLPLAAVTLFSLRGLMSGGRYLLGIVIGLAIGITIELMTTSKISW